MPIALHKVHLTPDQANEISVAAAFLRSAPLRIGNSPPARTLTFRLKKKGTPMSVKGELKEAAGFVKEEAYEHGKSPESERKAQEGRDLRNEGRIEDGKAPKTTKPGTGH
jgi:hypothetical protein